VRRLRDVEMNTKVPVVLGGPEMGDCAKRGVPVSFAFHDWQHNGKSIYDTIAGHGLTAGDLHHGTVFHGTLLLDATTVADMLEALEHGAEPVFAVFKIGGEA